MLDTILQIVRDAFGIDAPPRDLTYWQVSLRGLAIFVAALVMLRVGEHRFLGKSSVFDVVLGFLIGSTLSRAMNGSAPLGATLVGVAVLLGLHWIMGIVTFRSHRVGKIAKGRVECLVRDGGDPVGQYAADLDQP